MNAEKQKVAIAEFCGTANRWVLMKRGLYYRPKEYGYTDNIRDAWIVSGKEADKHVYPHDEPVTKHRAPLPDYPNDLNAMHEAWKCLKDENQRIKFCQELHCVVRAALARDPNFTDDEIEPFVENATAAQRCEAMVRTIGKWED